jgi:hypothetical protein
MTYIFDHIYKTGGTTFNLSYLLGGIELGLFNEQEVFIIRGYLNENREDLTRLMRLSEEQRRRLRIIAGHNAGLLRSAFPGAKFITVVRNPVDRVISGYLHAKYHEDAWDSVGREIEENNIGLAQFVDQDLFARRYAEFVSVQNWQSKTLLGSDSVMPESGALASAIQSRFYLVGYTEALELFLFYLHLTEGFPLILFNNRLVRRERLSFTATPEETAAIMRYNELDDVVYRCVQREFDLRVAEVWTPENALGYQEYLSALRQFQKATEGEENAKSVFRIRRAQVRNYVSMPSKVHGMKDATLPRASQAGRPDEGPEPYLSVVATSRNDDHGGSLLARMQVFVDALIGQCKRHSLSAELILVEWNPPPNRPLLTDALRWPDNFGPCRARIIEVPSSLHARYSHAGNLPLYQMIAKNVGIRRSQGQFVLATNIDILLNDELVSFIAGGHLRPDRMYRIDRHDVMRDVPVDGSVEAQLAYCERHLLRVNAREGTFPLAPHGHRIVPEPADPGSHSIIQAQADIQFGSGWYPPEQHFGEAFRWACDEAEIVLRRGLGHEWALALELEPGPSAGSGPLILRVTDASSRILGEITIGSRQILQLRLLTCAENQVLRLCAIGGGHPVPNDSRILSFRLFRYEWVKDTPGPNQVQVRAISMRRRLSVKLERWSTLWKHLLHAKEPLRVGLPLSPKLVQKLGLKIDGSGLSIVLDPRTPGFGLFKRAPAAGQARTSIQDDEKRGTPVAPLLHTNACGDFTLMAREPWFVLRGYPEFDAYSFNIDSILCYAAHYAGIREEILEEPMRSYHIEHQLGSGWTPEGQAELFERLAAEGIPYVAWPDVIGWAGQMHRLNCPFIFNLENWGLADEDLRETNLPVNIVFQ